MSVHDAADFKQHGGVRSQQREILQEANNRIGLRPDYRDPREAALVEFMVKLMLHNAADVDGTDLYVHSPSIMQPYPPSTTPISGLKPTSIQDLRIEVHHRGFYLLLRSLTPPNRKTAITSLMEDEKGDVVLIQLYQQEEEPNRPATSVVKPGTVLLVKEPYFRATADGEYRLRVDHVSDVVCLTKDHLLMPVEWQSRIVDMETTADDCRLKGNTAMEESRFWDAIST
jgi:hypothetical protein